MTREYPIRINRTCEYELCRKPFQIIPARADQRFCSRGCLRASQAKRVTIICEYCQKPFEVYPCFSHFRFCSNACRGKYQENQEIGKRYLTCANENCQKRFRAFPYEVSRRFCSYKCFKISKGPSSIEILMNEALTENRISFIPEFKVWRYHIDFALPEFSIAIECDGEYFHTDLEKDDRRDRYLESLGWTILRFSGTRIHIDINSCLREILQTIKNHSPSS